MWEKSEKIRGPSRSCCIGSALYCRRCRLPVPFALSHTHTTLRGWHDSAADALTAVELTVHVLLALVKLPLRLLGLLLLFLHPSLWNLLSLGPGPTGLSSRPHAVLRPGLPGVWVGPSSVHFHGAAVPTAHSPEPDDPPTANGASIFLCLINRCLVPLQVGN